MSDIQKEIVKLYEIKFEMKKILSIIHAKELVKAMHRRTHSFSENSHAV